MPPSDNLNQQTTPSSNPGGPSGTFGQPVTPQTPPMPGKPQWPLIVTVVVAVFVIAGIITYFVVAGSNTPSTDTKDTQSSSSSQKAESTVTSLTTTDSPNDQNGTVSFTHPSSWDVTKETDQYGTEKTIIKSPLGNTIEMYRSEGVGGSCDDDTDTYTLVKKLKTQNSSYVFTEYETPASWGDEALRLEANFDKKLAAHQALTEGKSNTGVCQNLFSYPIAKDIYITIKNASGDEARYSDIEDDAEFITALQSFDVTDN